MISTGTMEMSSRVFDVIQHSNRVMLVYGSHGAELFPVTDLIRFIGTTKSKEDILNLVSSDERVVVNVSRSNKRKYRIWTVTLKGLHIALSDIDDADDEYVSVIKKHYPQTCSKVTLQEATYTVTDIIGNPDVIIRILSELKAEQERTATLSSKIEDQKKQIEDMSAKAKYCDDVLDTKDAIASTIIAKDYGRSAKWLSRKLIDLRIIYRQNNTFCLFSKYADKGYTVTKTYTKTDEFGVMHSYVYTYWTQTGRKFIYDILADHGILPKTNQEATN